MISLADVLKFLESAAPYVLPSVLIWFLDRRRRKAEVRKTDVEADSTIAQAANSLVATGGTLVAQLEKQFSLLDADYKKVASQLEETNRRYLAAMEEIAGLSARLDSLRGEVTKLTNKLLDKEKEVSNLRKCLRWSLRHLRNLWSLGGPRIFMKGIYIPEPKDEDQWISRADELNGEDDPDETAKPGAVPKPTGYSGE